MTIEEFYEWLKKQPIEDKLVYMKYKYSWEDRWTVSNEYLEVDMSVDDNYVWLRDWNEGQEDVEILGCIDVGEIDIPLFEQEPVCDILAREYMSKVKCCDECFASTFCTINGLRNSRVPQDYCVENIKRYFGDKASPTAEERGDKR